MKILLVWPNKDQFGCKPPGLALMSALIKEKRHDVQLFDTTFIDFGFKGDSEVRTRLHIFKDVDFGKFDVARKQIDLEKELVKRLDGFKPDIVGISALSDEIYIGLEISRLVKEHNDRTLVVWGNKAATMASDKILNSGYVDFLCVGEGIEFISDFLDCVSKKGNPKKIKNVAYKCEDGTICKNELNPYYQDMDSLPFYDWSIFDKRQFLKPFDGNAYQGGDHMITWGCPYQCAYCISGSYRKLYGANAGKFTRNYSVGRIIKELKYLVNKWEITFFNFHDEDLCCRPVSYLHDLAEKYSSEVGVKFTIMANARSITKDKVTILKRMKCASVSLGIETANPGLRKMLKRQETPNEIVNATKILNDAGIRTSSFNMLGIPFENRATIMETIELNRRAEVKYPNCNFFFPFEGTPLRDIAIKNRFFDKDSKDVFQNDRPALKLPDITSEELVALRERFVLYVKMPTVLHKYIKKSEISDEPGKILTEKLYAIYKECVLFNDGDWNDRGSMNKYIACLNRIINRKYKVLYDLGCAK